MDGITMPLNDKLVVKFAFEHDLKISCLLLIQLKHRIISRFLVPLHIMLFQIFYN